MREALRWALLKPRECHGLYEVYELRKPPK